MQKVSSLVSKNIGNYLTNVQTWGGVMVNVKSYGATGDGATDDTVAIQAACDAAGTNPVVIPYGTYLLSGTGIDLNDGQVVLGLGFPVIKGSTYLFSANRGSGGTTSVSGNKRNIIISGIVFEHTGGFSEQVHQLNLNAVSDVYIEKCKFKAFRGDAIYLGSGNTGTDERHNERVKIIDCYFDGVNKDNRNAISIIDCDGLTVERSYFTNCTKSTLPGAIDCEPNDNAYHIIKDIDICNNKFYDIGGNVGVISFVLPAKSLLTTQPLGIRIRNNKIDTCASYAFQLQQDEDATNSTSSHDIIVEGNEVKNSARIFALGGMKGVKFHDNHFIGSANPGLLGTSVGFKNQDISFKDNDFINMATSDGGGSFIIYTIDRLTIESNTFIDCGKSDGTVGYGIVFGAGTSAYVSLLENRLLSPNSKTTIAIRVEGGHTLTPSTNIGKNNRLIGVTGNGFLTSATYNIDIESESGTWTPTIKGTSVAGSHTYSVQNGTYKRIGNMVVARCYVAITAKDAAMTGAVNVAGLPYANANIANTFTTVPLQSDNVTLTAGYTQISGLINANTSEIRLYQSGSGVVGTALGVSAIANNTGLFVTATYFIN